MTTGHRRPVGAFVLAAGLALGAQALLAAPASAEPTAVIDVDKDKVAPDDSVSVTVTATDYDIANAPIDTAVTFENLPSGVTVEGTECAADDTAAAFACQVAAPAPGAPPVDTFAFVVTTAADAAKGTLTITATVGDAAPVSQEITVIHISDLTIDAAETVQVDENGVVVDGMPITVTNNGPQGSPGAKLTVTAGNKVALTANPDGADCSGDQDERVCEIGELIKAGDSMELMFPMTFEGEPGEEHRFMVIVDGLPDANGLLNEEGNPGDNGFEFIFTIDDDGGATPTTEPTTEPTNGETTEPPAPTKTTQAGGLANTGAEGVGPTLSLAGMLVGVGAALLLASRRRGEI